MVLKIWILVTSVLCFSCSSFSSWTAWPYWKSFHHYSRLHMDQWSLIQSSLIEQRQHTSRVFLVMGMFVCLNVQMHLNIKAKFVYIKHISNIRTQTHTHLPSDQIQMGRNSFSWAKYLKHGGESWRLGEETTASPQTTSCVFENNLLL